MPMTDDDDLPAPQLADQEWQAWRQICLGQLIKSQIKMFESLLRQGGLRPPGG